MIYDAVLVTILLHVILLKTESVDNAILELWLA